MYYGIVDIGSNTVVLNIYAITEDSFDVVDHLSTPVHLVSYIHEKHMDSLGIKACKETLETYKQHLEEKKITDYLAFITEPWRHIDNAEELLKALEEVMPIWALTGEEEAMYDYLGSRVDVGFIETGNAFDIGGGSTELIAFRDNEIVSAVSIPYGCVRLQQAPLEQSYTDAILQETLHAHPALTSVNNPTLIGIGGTCRYTRKLYKAIYGKTKTMDVEKIIHIYQLLKDQDETMVQAMKECVNVERQPTFLPGLNMLVSICKAFNAKEIYFSKGCIREGILLEVLKKDSDCELTPIIWTS